VLHEPLNDLAWRHLVVAPILQIRDNRSAVGKIPPTKSWAGLIPPIVVYFFCGFLAKNRSALSRSAPLNPTGIRVRENSAAFAGQKIKIYQKAL
jgi:hypothetical protein